ncbi:MAG: M18 family aminopeptidase [Chlamydiae bacterium]|nr:M18 family aminopeptidase [Chlamydiota bacterium]
MPEAIEDLIPFLNNSPTAIHAALEIEQRLLAQGYEKLFEGKKWNLQKGKKYFVAREGAISLFHLPKNMCNSCLMLAAHTDSPALKIKPNPQIQKENITFLCTEVYGGPILSSWLNRDLAIAGKIIFLNQEDVVEQQPIYLKDIRLTIPQLSIHLDREVNEKGTLINKQDHLNAILGLNLSSENQLEKILKSKYLFKSLLAMDLFLVPIESAAFFGIDKELLSSYRIDNLVSVHAALKAMLSSEPQHDRLDMAVFWDHEEVGSRSHEGAFGSFADDVMQRIYSFYAMNEEDKIIMKSDSLCISIDMAHAFHACYESKFEPSHKAFLGKGVAIKYNSDQRYATNANTASRIIKHCQQHNLPYQNYLSRSDMACGSTVGPLVSHHLGIKTVDIGCAQLSMHSTREVISRQDYQDLVRLLMLMLQERA